MICIFFSFVSLNQNFINFFLISENQFFVLLIFLIIFVLFSILLAYAIIFISFSLVWVYFAVLFLHSWGGSFNYWFKTSFFDAWSVINFLLSTIFNCVPQILMCCIFIFITLTLPLSPMDYLGVVWFLSVWRISCYWFPVQFCCGWRTQSVSIKFFILDEFCFMAQDMVNRGIRSVGPENDVFCCCWMECPTNVYLILLIDNEFFHILTDFLLNCSNNCWGKSIKVSTIIMDLSNSPFSFISFCSHIL